MKKILLTITMILGLTACASTHQDVLGMSQTQVQMRNYQSRYFDTNNKAMVLRAVISTMQDLGFIIDKADEKLGTISGTSFTHSSKLTASVRAINPKQIEQYVREANRFFDEMIDDVKYIKLATVFSNERQ